MSPNKAFYTLGNIHSKHNKGYVTVLTLVLFSVLSLSLLAMFNSGQVVTHKLKLQNAVDAAAYSSAGIVSRELNYMAYTNRAMIANQIAVGQMVGMVSWNKMMVHASSGGLSAAVARFPLANALIGWALPYMSVSAALAESAISLFLNTTNAIPMTNRVIQALSESQWLVHKATQGLVLTTYRAVLTDNDPDAVMAALGGASLLTKYQNEVENFVHRTEKAKYGSSDLGSYRKFATVVKNSRDDFTKRRTYEWLSKSILNNIVHRGSIRKKGGSDFDEKREGNKYVWEWSAMDTVSLWEQYFNPLKWRWSSMAETWPPIGWGAAHTSNKPGRYNSYDSLKKWGSARVNTISSALADASYGANRLGSTSGLQRFYHINDATKNPTPPAFIAVAAKDAGSVKTWKEVVEDSGGSVSKSLDIEEKGNLLSSKMYVLAKSEPYFSRSHDLPSFRRADSNIEYGNLFNPYWQPRLVPLTPTEKATVLMMLPK